MKVLVINGSYRDDGFTDQIVRFAVDCLVDAGVDVETILLRNYPIQFCLNCRECTQSPGVTPGHCVQDDAMQSLVNKIEQSNSYILAAPTNFGSVTAIFKRFMERLIVYSYWPWSTEYPRFRKAGQFSKKALLVSSCAAPGFFGRLFYKSGDQLKMTAKTIGAKTVGTLFAGHIGKRSDQILSHKVEDKTRTMVARLIE